MFATHLLLALLPAIAYGRISIHVKSHNAGATVDFRGEDAQVITENELASFKINNGTLKKATEIFNGKMCTDIYVKPPTPWGDVYKENDWDVVTCKIKPIFSAVSSVSSKTEALSEQEYVNTNDSPLSYNMNVTKQVFETVAHIWTKGRELGEGREIEYKINFGDLSLGGSTTLTYSAPWGDGPMNARATTVGKLTSTSASLPPGGKTKVTLMAVHHRVEIEIRYEAVLDGRVFCNYDGGYKEHSFYAFRVEKLQQAARTPLSIYATETITLGFYTDPKLEISDGSS